MVVVQRSIGTPIKATAVNVIGSTLASYDDDGPHHLRQGMKPLELCVRYPHSAACAMRRPRAGDDAFIDSGARHDRCRNRIVVPGVRG